MAKRKGKAQRRFKQWHNEDSIDVGSSKGKFAARATKIPAWRLQSVSESLENLPQRKGMVVGLYPGGALVRSEAQVLICGVAGTFRPPEGASALTVGDEVTVAMMPQTTAGSLDKERSDGVILFREPRSTLLARPQPKSGKHHDQYDETVAFLKVVAANMDQLMIVAATRQPRLRPALIERYLIVAQRGDMKPVVVINKIDIDRPDEEMLAGLTEIGVTPLLASASTGEGLAELMHILQGKRTVLAGASGVGKSTLVNAIIPGASAATQPVRIKDQRGRHTTAATMVYDLPPERFAGGGMLLDTPGVRELAMEMHIRELSWYYPEFEPLVPQCRFRNCTHTHEPQCAVIAAVEAGAVPESRYDSYLRIAETLE